MDGSVPVPSLLRVESLFPESVPVVKVPQPFDLCGAFVLLPAAGCHSSCGGTIAGCSSPVWVVPGPSKGSAFFWTHWI